MRRFGVVWIVGEKVPFRRVALAAFAVSLASFAFDVAAQTASAPPAQPVQAVSEHRFLKLSEGERYWWYEGAIRTLGTWVASFDREKGDCIARWYLRDRDNKQKIIEDALARLPDSNEAAILVGLLIQACGDITPPNVRR